MSSKEEAAPVAPTFFDRCIKPVARPDWIDPLAAALPAMSKCTESGDVVIIAVDAKGDGCLAGYIIASGGQLVYKYESDCQIEDERAFWQFASSNYIWITPTLSLRKDVASRVGGKADGQSLRLESDSIGVAQFVEALLASIAGKVRAERKPVVRAMAPRTVKAMPTVVLEARAAPMVKDDAYAEPVPLRRVSDLAVGQTMAMF